jgi:hypothetical protein
MTEKYFAKFPTIDYRDKEARDITRRNKIEPRDRNNPYNFYPFTLQDEIRSDQVADFYYNDPEADWFVYHVNGIIDPYYDWYNTNETFHSLLTIKYGSVENAMKKVWVYRNNWALDDTQITPSFYENILTNNLKKYWQPVWGPKAEIISYKRVPIDTTMNTNRILRYTVTYVSGNAYTVGEIVDLKLGGEIVATGEVVYSNSSTLSIQSVSGNTVANSSVVPNIIGESSSTNATANAVVTVVENIPLSEEVYCSPVYYFEYEQFKNEDRKHIRLINDELAPFVITEFEQKLQE